jgi:hypothetical protein
MLFICTESAIGGRLIGWDINRARRRRTFIVRFGPEAHGQAEVSGRIVVEAVPLVVGLEQLLDSPP